MKQNEKPFINFEISKVGNANGLSTQLGELIQKNEFRSLNSEEKNEIINKAAYYYGEFLNALGCDWKNDPNSADTPRRVAKAYVNDLWAGRYNLIFPDGITQFPSENYEGIVLEKDIPLTSMCSHHHQTIKGKVHIAYIPKKEGKVVGLSKLNRVVEGLGRRGAIQEQLTVSIHNAISKITENIGVMVVIEASHDCCRNRGVKHEGAAMVTSEVSGVFANHEKTAKQEVLELIKWGK